MLRTVLSLRVGVSWELLVLLNWNITLICIAAMLLKLFCSNLLYPLKVETTRMIPFQHQCFQVYFEFVFLLQFCNALLVWKITLFSHDKVVVAQFQARRWFYAVIHAKWLPLIWEIKTKQCCICGSEALINFYFAAFFLIITPDGLPTQST